MTSTKPLTISPRESTSADCLDDVCHWNDDHPTRFSEFAWAMQDDMTRWMYSWLPKPGEFEHLAFPLVGCIEHRNILLQHGSRL
jgi:hypothetical protein